MAIQIRRGASTDFDATKMVAGELGVATDDSHKMWATGQAGDSWELANKEDLDAEVETREALAETVEEVVETVANKADADGTYVDMAVGDVVSDKKIVDAVPYLFRPSASVGERAYETIVGASVGENQLVQSGATSVTVQSGHKYYAKINGTESLGASTGSAITINDSTKDMVIDLTLMLPSAIADYAYSLGSSSGIAWLRSYGFLNGYQAYNAGTIESVEVTGKVVRGFNQWDEEWELGGISSNTGMPATASDRIRSKNFCPIVPNTVYYGYFGSYAPGGSALYIWFYDADQNFISGTGLNNRTTTAPANAYYFKLSTYGGGYTSYNNDICINLSSSRNGEYEPYVSHTYDLGSDVLRGIFKLDANNNLYADGDVKSADGTITRKYGVVDLGTLNWNIAGGVAGRFYAFLSQIAKPSGSYNVASNSICAKYQTITQNQLFNNVSGISTQALDGASVFVYDSTYTDATAFKTSMSGVYLVYELATPTTEQSTPFTSPQICYPDGTEEFVTENGVPVGHSTNYPYSIKALAEELIDIPDVPSANGAYVLKATRSASGIAYNWVADSVVSSLTSPLMSSSPQTQESDESDESDESEEEGETR